MQDFEKRRVVTVLGRKVKHDTLCPVFFVQLGHGSIVQGPIFGQPAKPSRGTECCSVLIIVSDGGVIQVSRLLPAFYDAEDV